MKDLDLKASPFHFQTGGFGKYLQTDRSAEFPLLSALKSPTGHSSVGVVRLSVALCAA